MTSLYQPNRFQNSPNTGLRQEISWQTIAGKRGKNIQMNENKNMAGQHRNGNVKFNSTKYRLPALFRIQFN